MNRFWVAACAVFGGAALAVMIGLNSHMATFVSPLVTSWVAHGIGAFTALLIIQFIPKPAQSVSGSVVPSSPTWSYLGGLPGAFVVVLASITVNGPLGLTGTLVLTITGQVLFSLMSDQWGWFGLLKRQMTLQRLLTLVPIVLGSLLIIEAKRHLA